MNASPEKQLYDSAGAYYLGAAIIMKPPASSAPTGNLLIQPAVTCAALSLKLYLKCLHSFDGKDDDTTYRIAELYKRLDNATKNRLLAKFAELSNRALSPDELLKRLVALDNAFVNWRYIHEEDAKSVNLEELEEMVLAAKATITAAKPDWE